MKDSPVSPRKRASPDKRLAGLSVEPPQPLPDRHGLAIVAIVKNVAAYLEEWLEFHRQAGVLHFFVYDNLSTDRTPQILAAHAARGTVTPIPWGFNGRIGEAGRRLSPQTTAYAHAVTSFGAGFERFAFIDFDEFLVPTRANDLMTEIRLAGSPSNISLPWHMFGPNGHKTMPAGGVIANYTTRARLPYERPEILLNFKCIVDPCKVTRIQIHRCETTDMGALTANMRGEIVANGDRGTPGFFCSEGIQLNHYYTRSAAEYEAKKRRGSINFVTRDAYLERLALKLEAIEAQTVEDVAAIAFLERAARARRIMALA
jgi:hypothetical protein